jgi:hypothetical protein
MLSMAEEMTMAKLTGTQLMVLSKASQRDDGSAVVPDRMNKAAAAKVAMSLVGKKLMREVRAKPGAPVWRHAEDGRALSLVLLRAGRDALGVADTLEVCATPCAADSEREEAADQAPPVSSKARPVGKRALIISMLAGPSGATLDELSVATGWLAHTTRAALTGLRQRGYILERKQHPDDPTTWRITARPISGAQPPRGRVTHLDQA